MAIFINQNDPRLGILSEYKIPFIIANSPADRTPRLRLGIINIMPQAELYEPLILRALSPSRKPLEVIWIRLSSHAYSSSSSGLMAANYLTFEAAIASSRLDGLIVTGAPVEELEFQAVHYWKELQEILDFAAAAIPSTLGLCWGAMALASRFGLEKRAFPLKLFGVYRNQALNSNRELSGGPEQSFWCPHSRHSGYSDVDLEGLEKSGSIRLLAHGPETGYSIFESSDQRFVMHLGHPEYEPERLIFEYERDLSFGRSNVKAPVGLNLSRPEHLWQSHRVGFFLAWIESIAAAVNVSASCSS